MPQTRFLDHPTDPTLWLIDDYCELDGEGKVSVAQTSQLKSLGMAECMKQHRMDLETILYYPPPGISVPSNAP